MEENVKDKVKQILTDYLQANRHRKTPERYAILDAIYSINGHFDIETLYHIMENEGKFRVSRATLYNTIILLIDANLVIKHQFGSSSQYERAYNNENHYHMICMNCGKVAEFRNDELLKAISDAKLNKFHPYHYSLYIYGICNKCNLAKRRKSKQIKNKET
jgi:Fe2+/Zn2+ uptake regulation proteins